MTEETMGKRISSHRKRLNLTQDALAEQLGVTAQAVSKWENDQSCPDIAMLPRIARVFGISVDELLGVAQPEKEAPVSAQIMPEKEPEESGWKMEWNTGRRGSIAAAVWVLLTGGLLLLSNIQGRGADLWDLLWSSALTVFGGYALLRRFTVLRLGCVLFGIHCILSEMHMAPFALRGNAALPLLLLLVGFSLLTEALRKPRRGGFSITGGKKTGKQEMKTEGEWFRCATSFGENHRSISLPRLSSGEAAVSFGELTVDLTACGEIADGCRLRGACSFGELEFRVPRCCRVEHAMGSTFGAVSVEGEPAGDAAAVIFLEGGVSFGEIKIKYF